MNLIIRDGANNIKYVRASGLGSDTFPFVIIKDVFIQDQTTPPFLVKANKVEGQASLTSQANIDDCIINVNSAVGIDEGKYLGLFNIVTDRYYAGNVLEVNGLSITLDTPIDSVFEIGDAVGFGISNMAVNGSLASPIEFNVRGADPGVNITVDITQITFICITEEAVDLTAFGDIVGGLVNGIVIQHVGDYTKNLVNFKTNLELKGWALDFEPLAESNPGQGLHGFTATMKFAGSDDYGVAIRIGAGEKISFYIQDPLNSLIILEALVKGHEVE